MRGSNENNSKRVLFKQLITSYGVTSLIFILLVHRHIARLFIDLHLRFGFNEDVVCFARIKETVNDNLLGIQYGLNFTQGLFPSQMSARNQICSDGREYVFSDLHSSAFIDAFWIKVLFSSRNEGLHQTLITLVNDVRPHYDFQAALLSCSFLCDIFEVVFCVVAGVEFVVVQRYTAPFIDFEQEFGSPTRPAGRRTCWCLTLKQFRRWMLHRRLNFRCTTETFCVGVTLPLLDLMI